METIKNFIIGLFVIILSLLLFVLIGLSWPLLVGIGSIILSIIAAGLFIVLIFYVIVLVGYLTRQFLKRKELNAPEKSEK